VTDSQPTMAMRLLAWAATVVVVAWISSLNLTPAGGVGTLSINAVVRNGRRNLHFELNGNVVIAIEHESVPKIIIKMTQ